ncbi:hypothetical protein BGU81_02425 [Clostridioides difficile]|nr:hypothetical protein BGU81_02425 [Clostridioides difficile]
MKNVMKALIKYKILFGRLKVSIYNFPFGKLKGSIPLKILLLKAFNQGSCIYKGSNPLLAINRREI